jgi:hypothetical protein
LYRGTHDSAAGLRKSVSCITIQFLPFVLTRRSIGKHNVLSDGSVEPRRTPKASAISSAACAARAAASYKRRDLQSALSSGSCTRVGSRMRSLLPERNIRNRRFASGRSLSRSLLWRATTMQKPSHRFGTMMPTPRQTACAIDPHIAPSNDVPSDICNKPRPDGLDAPHSDQAMMPLTGEAEAGAAGERSGENRRP